MTKLAKSLKYFKLPFCYFSKEFLKNTVTFVRKHSQSFYFGPFLGPLVSGNPAFYGA